MKRVNIGLKDEVHTQAKIIAVLKTMTLNDYFALAIEKAVQNNQDILRKLKK
jgi:hypothetical protein